MSAIRIIKPTPEQLLKWEVEKWTPWSCEPSEFEWFYPDRETAYVQKGHVTVKHAGEKVEIHEGDLVVFPKGLKCTWIVHETLMKVYTLDRVI